MWWASIKNSLVAVCFLLVPGCEKSRTEVIRLYMASSLMPLSEDIDQQAKSAFSYQANFLSSSAIAKQIQQGAPCDAVILADEAWQRHLINLDLVHREYYLLAGNALVLAANGNKDHFRRDFKETLTTMMPSQKLIIGDPDFVPLGAYTKEVLDKLGIFDQLSSQLVRAHSARHASLLLKQGAATLAILYRSDARNEGFFVVAPIDTTYHRPIEYPLLICKKASAKSINAIKMLFLSSPMAKIFENKGFVRRP